MAIKLHTAASKIRTRAFDCASELTRLAISFLLTAIVATSVFPSFVRAADDDIVLNTTEVSWDIATSVAQTQTQVGNDENGRTQVIDAYRATNNADGHVIKVDSVAGFMPGDGTTQDGPLVGVLLTADGTTAGADGYVQYTVGLNVFEDFINFINIFQLDPVPVLYSAKLGGSATVESDLQNQNPESPVFGQATALASVKLTDSRGAELHSMRLHICGVSTGSVCLNAEVLNSKGDKYEKKVDKKPIPWQPFGEFKVYMQANASFFTTIGRDYDYTPRYAKAQINAYADPTFQIDPDKSYEINGELVPATEIFELTVSQGIEYIGPTGPIVGGVNTDGDVTGVIDISGDNAADIAQLPSHGRPRIKYFSGASRDKIKTVNYLSDAWTSIAAATVRDGNSDGLDNDPAVAVLARKNTELDSERRRLVEVRRADDGALINRIGFMSPSWEIIDVAVIDDIDGDGLTGDTAIAVLGFNPDKPPAEQIKVQIRQLGDGVVIGNIYFFNDNWTPIALEAVKRTGESPLLAVLANKAATGANVIQARRLSDGGLHRSTPFWNTDWVAKDVSIIEDSNGDGLADDPAYLVLAQHPATGRNKAQMRRASDGQRLGNLFILGAKWNASRIAGSGDRSGNYAEEAVALAEKRTDGTIAMPMKDLLDGTSATIFP